jgi:hypothetical protein
MAGNLIKTSKPMELEQVPFDVNIPSDPVELEQEEKAVEQVIPRKGRGMKRKKSAA